VGFLHEVGIIPHATLSASPASRTLFASGLQRVTAAVRCCMHELLLCGRLLLLFLPPSPLLEALADGAEVL